MQITKTWITVFLRCSHLQKGGEVIRFEGDSDSTRYMLYSLAVAGDLVLSVALRVRIPLPSIRRLVREAAEELELVVIG